MNDNLENFDNICISSQDSDAESKSNHNSMETKKLDLPSNLYISNNNHYSKNNNLEKMLIDESSSDSEEVTFIRQISKPLLNSTSSKKGLIKHLYLRHQKKWAKVISLCFIVSLCCGIIIFLFFMCLPNSVMKYIQKEIWHKYIVGYNDLQVVGCNEVFVEDIWIKNFPQLISEGSIRLVKINDDDILDIVFPFGTSKTILIV